MSIKLGSTWAGLLNASFGNAVEIIVGIAALLQGKTFCGKVAVAFVLNLLQTSCVLCKHRYAVRNIKTVYICISTDARLNSVEHPACVRLFIFLWYVSCRNLMNFSSHVS